MKKQSWKEPLVRSVDSCEPVFGECKTGTSPITDGIFQCSAGTGASASGTCTVGNGAKDACTVGNGVKK